MSAMRKFTAAELATVLADHRKWRMSGGVYGSRADLTNADLTRADLTDANLANANLTRADLTGANLTRADLTNADLTRANLTRADLTRANLTRADLTNADLTRANLTDANLANANLTRADLTGANLTRADLTRADLARIRTDVVAVLDSAPNEVAGLLSALREGRIDGSTYSGDCACLVGTIANVRGCNYQKLDALKPDSRRPAERWFLGIGRGATPATNQLSAITEGWIVEWLAEREAKAAPAQGVSP